MVSTFAKSKGELCILFHNKEAVKFCELLGRYQDTARETQNRSLSFLFSVQQLALAQEILRDWLCAVYKGWGKNGYPDLH